MNKNSIEGNTPDNTVKQLYACIKITLFLLFVPILYLQAAVSYSLETSFTYDVETSPEDGMIQNGVKNDLSVPAAQQQITVTGRVVDQQGEPFRVLQLQLKEPPGG